MTTTAIIAIVVVGVIVLLGLVFAFPRMRERSRVLQREQELRQRRQQVSAEHRQEAELRGQQADAAERRAQTAEREARREREEAKLHEEQAAMHEQGLADHELVDEDERERFAGTSAERDPGDAAPTGEQWERDSSTNRNGSGMEQPTTRRSSRL